MIDTLVYGAASHLVESTLFVGAVALLTLAFRANRAQVRFWLWLSASFKFLIPFALLSMAGGHIRAWAPASSVEGIGATIPTFSFVAENFRHSSPDTSWGPASAAGAPAFDRTTLYQAIAVVWLSGVICVALIRLRGWRRIRLLIRGRVSTDIAALVEVRTSPGLMEPGVVGWIRPLVLFPQGISERLTPAEMNAILAHELCHVWRRDNLLASIHMIAETIFWFHPLVWWIGARLIEERECACDEGVVGWGNAPDLYAEVIVKICKWSMESPLTCVAGVTGGNLKKRIEQIMNTRNVSGLSFAKKAALTIAGGAVLMAPVLVGIANAPVILAQPPSGVVQWQDAAGGHMAFEVASVKVMEPGLRGHPPNFSLNDGNGFTDPRNGESPHGRFSAAFPVTFYITFAYKLSLTPDQRHAMFAHLPKWVDTDNIDIEAKAAGNPTKDQMRLMMQSLLAERFHLAVHYETQEMPVFTLTLIKPGTWGPKLIRHADGPPCDVSGPVERATGMSDPGAAVFPNTCESEVSVPGKNGHIVQGARNTPMAILTGFLSRMSGRHVVDRTGITDRIDFRLEWTLESNGLGTPGVEVDSDPNRVTFLDAVREQLGLKLESTKAPVQTLVIDHIERPSEN
jgi:bla regulator protein blaR1